MNNDIPVIDVGSLLQGGEPSADLVRRIDEACKSIGFFTVINHGVDLSLIERMFFQVEAFFDLPRAEKNTIEIHQSPYMRGYFSEGADKSDGVLGDIKEGFDMASDLPMDDAFVRAQLPFYGPNAWPEALPDFKVVMTEYHAQMLAFGKQLLKVFACALGMPIHYFDDKFQKPMAQLRALRYPSTEYGVGLPMGAGEHTDFGWITMIAERGTGGLQIKDSSGTWIPVTPTPGAFVVNVGDLMSLWTNDRYTATLHRVVNTSGELRHSAAFFMDPDYYAKVECLPSCCSEIHPAKYDVVLAGEYMDRRFRETTTFRELKTA